jgi:archaemetzincin
MKLIFIPLFFTFVFLFPKKESKVIHIIPEGNVDKETLVLIKNKIETFYGFKCSFEPKIYFTKDLLSKSKKRYDALKILKNFKSPKNILIITEKDIVHKNEERNIDEWGIIGLGFRPGTVCVVSTYRIKNNVTKNKFNDRLLKVSLHEIGHNLGIDHCNNDSKCLMSAANGKVSRIDSEKFYICDKCRKQIK